MSPMPSLLSTATVHLQAHPLPFREQIPETHPDMAPVLLVSAVGESDMVDRWPPRGKTSWNNPYVASDPFDRRPATVDRSRPDRQTRPPSTHPEGACYVWIQALKNHPVGIEEGG